MKNKLPRKWARICILSITACIVCLTILGITNNIIWLSPSIAFMIAAFVIRCTVLCCPVCGKSSAVPQWTKSGTYFCPLCGTKLEYDDIEN